LRIGRDRKYGSHSASRIVFLGWLDQTKGILELLRVFSALLTDHPRAQLLIAGEGDCSQAVRDFVYDNDLQGSIRLLGWVRDEQKINLLREGTIFCLPSYFEGMPNAMIEAMAAGLPIIVTAVGAIPSVIDDGINGLIIPVHDENSLRETLRKLMEDQALQEQLGTAAHQFARDNFGAEMAVKRIRKLFEY
jgi:glycosyltransferase involved in cell wall biosynthesis